jgi:hypothetical protein
MQFGGEFVNSLVLSVVFVLLRLQIKSVVFAGKLIIDSDME